MSLRNVFIKSFSIMMVIKSSRSIILFVMNLILARILLPIDFGIASVGIVIITIISRLSDLGIETATIQKRKKDIIFLSTAANIRMIFSITFTIFFLLSAPLFTIIYNNDKIGQVIQICSIMFILQAIGLIPRVIINIELKFNKLLIPAIGSNISIFIIAIILAINQYGYWSIILSTIFGTIINAILLWIVCPWKIQFKINLNNVKELLGFGKFITLSLIISAVIINIDKILIGIFLNVENLGYYSISYTWGTFFVFNIATVVSGFLFPTLSSIKDQLSKIDKSYITSIKYFFLIATPVVGMLILYSEIFIIIFLGEKWLPSNLSFKFLNIFSLVFIIYFLTNEILLSLGKVKFLAKVHILIFFVLIITIYPFSIIFGILGGALSLLFSFSIGSITMVLFTCNILNRPIYSILSLIKPIGFSASIIIFINWFFLKYFMINIFFIIIIGISIILYVIFIKIFSSREYWSEILITYRVIKKITRKG